MPPCVVKPFSRPILVPYSLQAYIYAPQGLGLVRGEGKGVATPPSGPTSTLLVSYARGKRDKGSILRIG